MGYYDIFCSKEAKYYAVNQHFFKCFLELFRRETGIDYLKILDSTYILSNDYRQIFFAMRNKIIMCYPKYVKVFFILLENCGFDVSYEIIYAMKVLGKNTVDIIDSDIKEYVLLSPVIDLVTCKSGAITIFSEEFGDFSFISTRKYLMSNKKALYLIKNYLTNAFCHQISWELMKYLDESSLITSLLPSYFEGDYYHTVVRNNDGLIIDAANEVVIDEDTREYLFKCRDIVETKKSMLDTKLKEALNNEDEESKKLDIPNAMLLALHKEYKDLSR